MGSATYGKKTLKWEKSGFTSQLCYLLPLCLAKNCLTFLKLSFLLCKMRVIILYTTTTQKSCEDGMRKQMAKTQHKVAAQSIMVKKNFYPLLFLLIYSKNYPRQIQSEHLQLSFIKRMIILIPQWFSSRVIFVPQGTFGNVQRHFTCHTGKEGSATGIQYVESRNDDKHSQMHRTAFHNNK